MKIGLYFGSFNPIHNGHIAIADYWQKNTELDEIWLIVSPHNPLKEKQGLYPAEKRLDWARQATNGTAIKVCAVEFQLPQPSYTIDTLTFLSNQHSDNQFDILMGQDSIENIHRWKNYQTILDKYTIWVYPRGEKLTSIREKYPSVQFLDAPLWNISSTQIRTMITKGEDISGWVPQKILEQLMFYM